VPAAQLKHLLVKVSVGGKVAICEELLALLVIGGKHESRENRAKLADLMYDALRLAQAIAQGIDFVRVFGNLQRCIEQAQILALQEC
jgi:hypothetical protein